MSLIVAEAVAEIKSARVERTRRLPVFRLRGPSTELLPPGSGILLLASKGSDVFDELHQALEEGDNEKINDIVTRAKPIVGNRRQLSIDDALSSFKDAQAVADLTYVSKPVVVNAFSASDAPYTRILFPFAGGTFVDDDFILTEYLDASGESNLEALVVVHPPRIGARERAVFRDLPAESRGMVFGPADPVMATPAALVATVTAGIIVATVGTALGHCSPQFEGIDAIILPPFDRQNAALSVKQLLAARQQALNIM